MKNIIIIKQIVAYYMKKTTSLGKSNQKHYKSTKKEQSCQKTELHIGLIKHNDIQVKKSLSIANNTACRIKTEYEQFQSRSKDKGGRTKGYSVLASNQPNVKSTKNNPIKTNQLKNFFNNRKESPKNSLKGKLSNHPFFKYINRKKPNLNPFGYEVNFDDCRDRSISKSVSKSKNDSKNKSITKKSINNKKITVVSPKNEDQQITIKTIQKYKIVEKNKTEQIEDDFGLTEEQKKEFGNRFPTDFQKIKLLGRGGFSLVWLGKHKKNQKKFAIKQIMSNNNHQTHLKQIQFSKKFFEIGGLPKKELMQYVGLKNLVRLYYYEINHQDAWIYYELCGNSLGSSLYDIKSQKPRGGQKQKTYKMVHRQLYKQIAKNPSLLKQIFIELCNCLKVINKFQIVHSDIKTQNILLKYEQNNEKYKITEVKLIDYGSSFNFRRLEQFSMATPEYMPPQILNYILHENEGDYEVSLYNQVMSDYRHCWAVDVWSLGCVLLEIVIGVPLWMSLPMLVHDGQQRYKEVRGLFAVKGRTFKEIISKQRYVVHNLSQILKNQMHSGIVLDESLKKALLGMLDLNFNKRISPEQIIQILS